jgi:hypothetical protein
VTSGVPGVRVFSLGDQALARLKSQIVISSFVEKSQELARLRSQIVTSKIRRFLGEATSFVGCESGSGNEHSASKCS